MQASRGASALRSHFLPSLRASTSHLPVRSFPPRADRYLVIRNFFTEQARVNVPSAKPIRNKHKQLAAQGFSGGRVIDYLTSKPFISRRWNTSTPSTSDGKKPTQEPCPNCPSRNTTATPPPIQEHHGPTTPAPGHAQDYTPFIRRLIQQSSILKSNSLHRPTKEQLLAAANSWWERLRIRIKWFTIRGWRRFNADDLSFFASWLVVGNLFWVVIGTTTFVSAVFATLNWLSLQQYVARWISDYMTSETGVTVIFENAIVPKFGRITFRNVYISRRPQDPDTTPSTPRVSTATPPSPIPFLSSSLTPSAYNSPPASEVDNYTMFDINIDEVEVSLNFMRWLDGKGLVKDAKVKGVRGVVDRRSVWWDLSKPIRPEDWRHATRPGDFELESFQMEDALITVYQPGGQRPYNVSVFNAIVGPLRKRWLFHDIMSAEAITGQFDNCLFSLHMPQKLGKAIEEGGPIKRMARFRIDGLPIEHAQYATGHAPPVSWITSGKLDAVLDISFPYHPEDSVDLKAIFEKIGQNVADISHGVHPDHNTSVQDLLESQLVAENSRTGIIPGQARLARPALRAPVMEGREDEDREGGLDNLEEKRQVKVDIDLRFRDLKAAVPIYTSDLSVTNNALIRPIVAFINANRTLVPIHCSVASDLSDFDGSWTLFETGLMTSVSHQIYSAMAHHVSSEAANTRRIKQVSVWGIQRGAEVLLDTLRNVMDPVHAQLAVGA